MLFGVGQNFRWNRSVETMREMIAAGRIGTPQLAHAQFNYMGNLATRTWIADAALACGGPIADVGVHCIDALRFILEDDVKTISTLASKDVHSGEVEAIATMQMQMRSGMYMTVATSARSPYRTLLEVVGSDGVLIAENGLTVDQPVEVILRKGGKVEETKTLDNSDGYTPDAGRVCARDAGGWRVRSYRRGWCGESANLGRGVSLMALRPQRDTLGEGGGYGGGLPRRWWRRCCGRGRGRGAPATECSGGRR